MLCAQVQTRFIPTCTEFQTVATAAILGTRLVCEYVLLVVMGLYLISLQGDHLRSNPLCTSRQNRKVLPQVLYTVQQCFPKQVYQRLKMLTPRAATVSWTSANKSAA